MSILAACFWSFDGRAPVRPEALRDALTRTPADPVEFQESGAWIGKVDFGSYGAPAHVRAPGGGFAMAVGDPVRRHGDDRNRTADLASMLDAWLGGDDAPWARATGSYAAVFWNPEAQRVELVADAMGLRPLYYSVHRDGLIVSSALRVFESLANEYPLSLDPRAAGEFLRLRYPLADRTPYAEVRRVESATSVRWERGTSNKRVYFDWGGIATDGRSGAEHADRLADAFRDAMRRRATGTTHALSLLSGGLDSRVLVSTLDRLDVGVSTYCFGPPKTKDTMFAGQFAQRIGLDHQLVTHTSPGRSDWGSLTGEALAQHPPSHEIDPPHTLWTGDNGSFTIGFVHMDKSFFQALRDGDDDRAIDRFLATKNPLPRKLIRAEWHQPFDHVREGLRTELTRDKPDDPAKRMYLMYLRNEARHVLDSYFEDLDRHRLDPHTPFCDAAFVAEVLRGPMDAALGHKLYHAWMARLDGRLIEVPWQTYPGHEPCPLDDTAADSQWVDTEDLKRIRRRHALDLARDVVGGTEFPHHVLPRGRLMLQREALRLRARDTSYAFVILAPLRHHLQITKGRLADGPS